MPPFPPKSAARDVAPGASIAIGSKTVSPSTPTHAPPGGEPAGTFQTRNRKVGEGAAAGVHRRNGRKTEQDHQRQRPRQFLYILSFLVKFYDANFYLP